MIKLNSIFRFHFSTIRYSQEYVKTFHLNRKLRSCLSLNKLKEFVETHDQEIQQYGKTIVLEYFNEFPTNFVFRTFDSPLGVFKYVFDLQGLSLYEEQMKYANLCKMVEYAARQSYQLNEMVRNQEKKIFERTKIEPFDVIDSLNWVLIQRNTTQNLLIEHSLTIICNTPIERSESIMTKMLNTFLKKIEDLQWKNLRKFRKLFEFMCNKYELSVQSPKIMISNFQKLVNMKLHLLGYDRIPRAIDQICNKLETEVKNLDLQYLQIAFKCFQSLPSNYNRKLFKLILQEIIKKMDGSAFHLQYLPITLMTKIQLEQIMKAYFKNGFQIKSAIYHINAEQSNFYFSSETYLKNLTEAFLKPPEARQLKKDYIGYFSTGRALLNYYESNGQKKNLIINQLKLVHKAFYMDVHSFKDLNLATSLCGWFNVLSLELEIGLFNEERKIFMDAFEQEVRKFTSKKFSSNWKVKKHYAQVRQVLKKYANSKFPQIQKYIREFVSKDLKASHQFDSLAFPHYIFMLEESEHRHVYQSILKTIYNSLQAEDAYSFIETYICYNGKSSRLNNAIIEQFWALKKDPMLMLKIVAGVPLIYFEAGLGQLFEGPANILQDVAIFMKIQDLDAFSIGELINIIIFCRRFLKFTKTFSQKVLILTVTLANNKLEEKILQKKPQAQISFFIELLNLCVELNQSDQAHYIDTISKMLQKVQTHNTQNPQVLLRLLEVKFLLKKSIPIDSKAMSEAIRNIITKIKQSNSVEEKSKIFIVLLKLYALDEINLDKDELTDFTKTIKKALQEQQVYPNEIQNLLGSSFIEHFNFLNYARITQLNQIISFSLTGIKVQEKIKYYIYYMRYAHKIKNTELIEQCLDHLTLLPLEPPFIIEIVNILKYYTYIYKPDLLHRIIMDTVANFTVFRGHLLDILFYINLIYYDLPTYQENVYYKMLEEVEKGLQMAINSIRQSNNPKPEDLHQILINTYRYYWIVIKNKKITAKTYSIFKFNVSYIHSVYQILNVKSLDNIQADLIYMINILLFKNIDLAVEVKPVRTKFFSQKKVVKKSIEQYKSYHEYMQKIQKFQHKKLSRCFEIEQQLRKLKVHLKRSNSNSTDTYFIFAEKHNDIQVQYFIKIEGKDYYVIVLSKIMKNNAGLYKGRVKLMQQLYKSIIGKQIIFVDEGEIMIELG